MSLDPHAHTRQGSDKLATMQLIHLGFCEFLGLKRGRSPGPIHYFVLTILCAVALLFWYVFIISPVPLSFKIGSPVFIFVALAIMIFDFYLKGKDLWQQDQLALRLGLQVEYNVSEDIGYGILAGWAYTPKWSARYSGLVDARLVVFGNYYDETETNGPVYHPVILIFLDRPMPRLFVDARGNNTLGAEVLLEHNDLLEPIELEGDFNSYFRAYAKPGSGSDAFYILTPDLAQVLMSRGNKIDFETDRDCLLLYSAYAFDGTEKSLKNALNFAQAITERLDKIHAPMDAEAGVESSEEYAPVS